MDITTGEFAATELTGLDLPTTLRAELVRLRPGGSPSPADASFRSWRFLGTPHPGRPGVSNLGAARKRSCAISRPAPWMALACTASLWRSVQPERSFNT